MALVAGTLPADVLRFREELVALCVRGFTPEVAGLLQSLQPAQVAEHTTDLDRDGSSALHVAARYGHLLLLKELLQRGCEATWLDSTGQTPIHIASFEGHADLVVELLLAKAEPNSVDAQHETALHKAVEANSPEVLDVLLSRAGADPAIGNGTQTTPTLLAAARGKLRSLEVLLRHNSALAAAANESGWTALHLAAHGDTHPRKVTVTKAPKFLACLRLLLESKAAVDATDEDKKTPLHRASTTGNVDSAKALVESGADVAAADICRWTPLHFACQEGHLQVVQMLLIAKAPAQQESPSCLTPLAIATNENQVKIAEVLLRYLADPNLGGKGLASPMAIARKEPAKYSDILALFEIGFVHH